MKQPDGHGKLPQAQVGHMLLDLKRPRKIQKYIFRVQDYTTLN
jgi:hypothetical protein